MVKCIKLYRHNDGRVELAKSESNNWFIRSYEQTKYGYAWTKWSSLGLLKSFKRKSLTWENLNGNEITTKSIDLIFLKGYWNIKLSNKININKVKYRLPY